MFYRGILEVLYSGKNLFVNIFVGKHSFCCYNNKNSK